MRDFIFGLGFLIVLALPFVAIAWIIYRYVKGSSGNNRKITGD